MARYQVLANYTIAGKEMECLASTATASGDWSICFNKESAEQRVQELREAGLTARYEDLPQGTAWFDDENWIG